MAQRTPQRLYRSRVDKMLGGVCGGLGEYFDVDPVLVRLGFVILTILGSGVGVLIYLVLWIVIPKEGSLSTRRAELWRENVVDMAAEARRLGDDVREAIDPTRRTATPADNEPADTSAEPVGAAGGAEGRAPRWEEAPAAPAERDQGVRRRQMLAGAVLVIVGLWLLAANLHLVTWVRGDLLWPLALVVVGGWLLMRQVRRPD